MVVLLWYTLFFQRWNMVGWTAWLSTLRYIKLITYLFRLASPYLTSTMDRSIKRKFRDDPKILNTNKYDHDRTYYFKRSFIQFLYDTRLNDIWHSPNKNPTMILQNPISLNVKRYLQNKIIKKLKDLATTCRILLMRKYSSHVRKLHGSFKNYSNIRIRTLINDYPNHTNINSLN